MDRWWCYFAKPFLGFGFRIWNARFILNCSRNVIHLRTTQANLETYQLSSYGVFVSQLIRYIRYRMSLQIPFTEQNYLSLNLVNKGFNLLNHDRYPEVSINISWALIGRNCPVGNICNSCCKCVVQNVILYLSCYVLKYL
jgi:hypothetical protein